MSPISDVPGKANRVLVFILLALLLILMRVWYLAIIQHEAQVSQAQKPKRRIVIEPVERGTIVDRFGVPLAVNKVRYNAAVCYASIREIPSIEWKKGEKGKLVKVQARLNYISELSQLLAQELHMDPVTIEDTIHGKASLFPHTPFVIKENISEEQYARLRMLEKDWRGIQPQKAAERFYPQGKVACDVLGYLGSISSNKYHAIAEEMQELEAYLSARERNESPFLPKGFDSPVAVRDRLHDLQEKSYTINDLVGKAGVEAFYEEELRGLHGKKIHEVDVKGNFLREMAGSHGAVSGKRVVLNISAELQAYAESLLAAHEGAKNPDGNFPIDEGWIKGGAIVAMIPQTGEVVALASYPRFDPNDFLPGGTPVEKREKYASVLKWLESMAYIGDVWDGKQMLSREYYSFPKGTYVQERISLSWEAFLRTILSPSLLEIMNKIPDLQMALRVQEAGVYHPILRSIKKEEDRLLILDLCHLAAAKENFPPPVVTIFGSQSLSDHHLLRQAAMRLLNRVKIEIQELYHDIDFSSWRRAHFKELLRKKRKEEKENKRYARPYTDYLDTAEKSLFQSFWEAYKWVFFYAALTGKTPIALDQYPHLSPYMAHLFDRNAEWIETDASLDRLRLFIHDQAPQMALSYLQTMRGFDELSKPLLGKYRRLRHEGGLQLEKHLAAAFYPMSFFGHCRSQGFRQVSALGSVFKLVTAYEALKERHESNKHGDLNPLTLIDDLKGERSSTSPNQVVGYTLDGSPILRMYKGGMLPRSSHSGIGKIDLIGALEQSSNIYFSMLAGDYLEDPTNLSKAAKEFGFGQKTGIDLPGELKGVVPDDLAQNRTGLYSFAIGQHAFEVTPLQTAVMAAAIVNKGVVIRPQIVHALAGAERVCEEEALFSIPRYPFQEALASAGIYFPLFTETVADLHRPSRTKTAAEIVRTLAFPSQVAQMILEGMHRSVCGSRGSSRPGAMVNAINHPTALQDYFNLHRDMIAKTGTAQLRHKQFIDVDAPSEMRRHVWFAGISYPTALRGSPERYDHPELVVVVFLRFAQAGREGGPLAGQIVKKWRALNTDRK